MTKHKCDLKAVRDNLRKENALRRKRSAAIKRLAEASAALDAHFKYWAAPGFLQRFNFEHAPGIVLAATRVEEELEFDLAIELNNLCYIDQELSGERNDSEWAARGKAVKGKPVWFGDKNDHTTSQ